MFRLVRSMSKKDFVYLVVILLMVILFQFLRGNLDESEVVNVISIGAGLTSIFLAMIAIEFSFKQSDEAKNQSTALTQVLNNINDKVHELSKVKDELNWVKEEFVNFRRTNETQNLEIIQSVKFIQESVQTQIKDVTEKIAENPASAQAELENLENKISMSLEHLKAPMLIESEVEASILNAINLEFQEGGYFSFDDLRLVLKRQGIELFDYSPNIVRKALKKLEEQGLIKRIDNHPVDRLTRHKYHKVGQAVVLTPVEQEK